MKKINNKISAKATRAVLFTLMPFMFLMCKSREQKIAEAGENIHRIEAQIDSVKSACTKVVEDSASKNALYAFLNRYINEDTPRVDSLRTRNFDLMDSIQTKHMTNTAKQYPLSTLLSKNEIRVISNQLKEFCSEWNENSAAAIIAGRGTLWDLYNVCFDLDYTLFEPSFHIINDDGAIRFGDWRDKVCIEFEAHKRQCEREEILNEMHSRARQLEYAKNQADINEYERKCVASDSVYMEIESHVARQFKPRLDSLENEKQNLIKYRTRLMHESLILSR